MLFASYVFSLFYIDVLYFFVFFYTLRVFVFFVLTGVFMKVLGLKTNPAKYSSNSYFIRGNFNSISDANTLIDTGADNFILNEIESLNTGLGKRKVEQIILTHTHFDHTGGLKSIKEKYDCDIYAFSDNIKTTKKLNDGDVLHVGDGYLNVIYTPEHSSDSICLYSEKEKILFSGDINFLVNNKNEIYSAGFISLVQKLLKLKIETIYPGHGRPLLNAFNMLEKTFDIISA